MATKLSNGRWRNRKHGPTFKTRKEADADLAARADARAERSARRRILDSHSDDAIAELAGAPSANRSLPGVPAR